MYETEEEMPTLGTVGVCELWGCKVLGLGEWIIFCPVRPSGSLSVCFARDISLALAGQQLISTYGQA